MAIQLGRWWLASGFRGTICSNKPVSVFPIEWLAQASTISARSRICLTLLNPKLMHLAQSLLIREHHTHVIWKCFPCRTNHRFCRRSSIVVKLLISTQMVVPTSSSVCQAQLVVGEPPRWIALKKALWSHWSPLLKRHIASACNISGWWQKVACSSSRRANQSWIWHQKCVILSHIIQCLEWSSLFRGLISGRFSIIILIRKSQRR